MNIKANIATSSVKHADNLIHFIQATPQALLFGLSLIFVISWVAGNKLSKFAKPENPKASIAIREIASWISIIGMLVIILFLVYLLIVFTLVFLWISLSDEYGAYSSIEMSSVAISQIWLVAHSPLTFIILGSFLGLVFSLYLSYYLIPQWESGEGLDDVEQTVKRFKKLDKFDATSHFDLEKGCFFGKDIKGLPVYVSWEKLRETHMQILGTTGSGKGIIATVIASQCVLNKEGLVWFDPKSDEFAPIILSQMAALAKKKFHFIKLDLDQPAQFNLIAGSTVNDIEEMLVAGFGLRGQGGDADFYRGKDEDAAILMANIALRESAASIPQLFQLCSQISQITDQENFWRKFKKLASMSVINTTDGLNLKDAILNGDVIYVVGSCDNERVIILQKMLLVRLMQIIKKRDRINRANPICVFLDEFKYLLSTTALSALGVVRSFNSHFILAHQSLGDLAECPGISPESAYGAVVDNTSIKVLYRINDALHAEKMAKLSGEKRTFVASTSKNHADVNSHSSGWMEANKYFISPDLITHLPITTDRPNQASVGILFGIGNAKILHVGRIEAKGEMPEPLAADEYKSVTNSALSAEEFI